jgi:hypothetical protein
MRGLSVLLAFGKPVWPKVQLFTGTIRIVVGPAALYLSLLDLDALLVKMSQALPEPAQSGRDDASPQKG